MGFWANAPLRSTNQTKKKSRPFNAWVMERLQPYELARDRLTKKADTQDVFVGSAFKTLLQNALARSEPGIGRSTSISSGEGLAETRRGSDPRPLGAHCFAWTAIHSPPLVRSHRLGDPGWHSVPAALCAGGIHGAWLNAFRVANTTLQIAGLWYEARCRAALGKAVGSADLRQGQVLPAGHLQLYVPSLATTY